MLVSQLLLWVPGGDASSGDFSGSSEENGGDTF